MVAAHGHRLRYVPLWGRWFVWDGHRWAADETGEVARAAKGTARTFLRTAVDTSGEPRKALIKAATRAESASGQRGIIELAGTEEGVALAPRHLDSHPYLLNTRTGVLDLDTGELRPHDPDLNLTKLTGAGYRPDATAPEFTRFLDRIQPDPVMRAFLARLLGYSLLGVVREHVLPVLHGTGANGKSTLLDAVLGALGDYAGTADPGLLIDRGEVHPTGAADLFGRRLVVTHESDAGRRLAEGTVKRLTGGDRIKARRMREDFWEFEPSHLMLMITNHRPVVRGDDEAIWRRLRLVPFDVEIPEAERDGDLGHRLAAERDGILTWLVGGLAQWRAHGLDEPEPVRVATATYRADSGGLAAFLTQRCVIGPHYSVRAGDLFETYRAWCSADDAESGPQNAFGRAMTARGYEKQRRTGGVWWWTGLGLQPDESDTS